MSVSIGLYDFFSFAVPGFVYLYVLNETLKLIKVSYVDINQLSNVGYFIIVGIVAYVVGHLMVLVVYRVWMPLWKRDKKNPSTQAVELLKQRNPELEINFSDEDWRVFLSVLRLYDVNSANLLIKFNVDSIMLRNLSFGFLLFAVLQLAYFITYPSQPFSLITMMLSLVLSIVAIIRSKLFDLRFYSSIYESALCFGTDKKSVLKNWSKKGDMETGKNQMDLFE